MLAPAVILKLARAVALVLCSCGKSSAPPVSALQGPQVPPAESGTTEFYLDFIGSPSTGNVWFRDRRNDAVVLNIANVRQFAFQDPDVRVDHRYRPQPSGFDLIVDCHNPTGVTKPVPSIVFENFNLGRHVQYRDFRYNARLKQGDWNDFVGIGHNYPDSLYSPVWVMGNDKYTIGLSLLYPLMQYKHDVQIIMSSPSLGPDDPYRGWLIEFRPVNPPGETSVTHPATLAPGETKRYVIALRVTRTADRWMETLLPYRRYFQSLYGGVKYTRDPSPVWPVSISSTGTATPDNLLGFNWPLRRPDLYGWAPWTTEIISRASDFSRVMLWGPSGLYHGAAEAWNYPYQFTSNWLTNSNMAMATHPVHGLRPIRNNGIELGLWWGRSVQIARTWNPISLENFNPRLAEHRNIAFAELDLAVQAGAQRIGLDSYAHGFCPGWELVYWLQLMQARHPGLEFVTEAMCFDILHSMAPTFMAGWPASIESFEARYPVNTPHYLADFLLPGHELWLAYSYNAHRAAGIEQTQEMMSADQVYIASLGYVPIILDYFFVPMPGIQAAESWRESVPVDLQGPDEEERVQRVPLELVPNPR